MSLTTKTSEKSLRGNAEKTPFLDISLQLGGRGGVGTDENEMEEVIDEEEEEEESGYSSDDVFATAKHLEEVAESLERSLRDSAESASRIIKEDLERKIDATRKAREEAETNVELARDAIDSEKEMLKSSAQQQLDSAEDMSEKMNDAADARFARRLRIMPAIWRRISTKHLVLQRVQRKLRMKRCRNVAKSSKESRETLVKDQEKR